MFSGNKDKVGTAKDGIINEGSHGGETATSPAHHFRADASAAASAVRDDLEGVARCTGHQARELADSAGHSLSDMSETMTRKIRQSPVQSSLIALGLGVVVGALVRR